MNWKLFHFYVAHLPIFFIKIPRRKRRKPLKPPRKGLPSSTDRSLKSQHSHTARSSHNLNADLRHAISNFVDQLPPGIRNARHPCVTHQRHSFALQKGPHQIEHFRLVVSIQRYEHPASLSLPAVHYLRLDVLHIRQVNAVQLINSVYSAGIYPLVILIQYFFSPVLQKLYSESILFLLRHSPQILPPLTIVHIGVVVKIMGLLLFLQLFRVDLYQTGQTQRPKPFLHLTNDFSASD